MKGIRKNLPRKTPPVVKKLRKKVVKTIFSKLLLSFCDIFQEFINIPKTEIFYNNSKSFVWKELAPLNISRSVSLIKLLH